MLLKRDKNTLYCFSPPVMIATFAIEIGLVLYTIWRYKLTTLTRLTVVLFMALATFQLAEFMVCQEVGGNTLVWSRIGYGAITLLPPIGLHILHTIVKSKNTSVLWPGYIAAAAFMAFFTLTSSSIEGHACLGNYVIFQVAPGAGGLFGLYYYGLLIATLSMGWYYLRTKQPRKTKRAVGGLMLGYAIFIIPATTANLLSPETIGGMPSIMCGFAVLLALLVAGIVLPSMAEGKR